MKWILALALVLAPFAANAIECTFTEDAEACQTSLPNGKAVVTCDPAGSFGGGTLYPAPYEELEGVGAFLADESQSWTEAPVRQPVNYIIATVLALTMVGSTAPDLTCKISVE